MPSKIAFFSVSEISSAFTAAIVFRISARPCSESNGASVAKSCNRAAIAIASARERSTLREALATRTVIGQAEGILMERFGVDKPDLRFGLELIELTAVFGSTEFKAFAGAASIKGLCVKASEYPEAAAYGRNKLDALTDRAKKLGAKGLVWMKVGAAGDLDSPVAKFLTDDEKKSLLSVTGAVEGDLILIVADEWMNTVEVHCTGYDAAFSNDAAVRVMLPGFLVLVIVTKSPMTMPYVEMVADSVTFALESIAMFCVVRPMTS